MKTLREICESHDTSELDSYLEIRSCAEIFKDIADMTTSGPAARKERVERAAIAIFSGMQANPNWVGSSDAQAQAVQMAKSLVYAIDNSF
jgi:hypothetical protein